MRKSAIPCTICGKAAPPGALLCPPCRAALKRAGHLTVQDLPHYLAPVRRSRSNGHRPSDAKRPPPAAPAPAAVAGAGRRVLLAAAALAVLAVAAYMGQPRPDPAPDARAARTIADLETASPATIGSAAAVPAASAAAAPAPQAPSPAVADMQPPRPVAPRTPPRTKQAALRAEATVVPVPLPVAESVAAAPEPPPAPVPREAPPPDRWQQMSDALARCDREGGFSGFICDQRVRLDSCEGHWGTVPQCPNPPENPR